MIKKKYHFIDFIIHLILTQFPIKLASITSYPLEHDLARAAVSGTRLLLHLGETLGCNISRFLRSLAGYDD